MTQSNFSLNFKFNFCALALSLAALIPCLSWADPVSTTGSFPASATVVQPLTITGASTLSFGSFVAGHGGTVTIPSTTPYTRTSTSLVTASPLVLVASNSGGVSTINISGIEETTYTVTLPGVPTTLSSGTGGATMSITKITSNLTDLAGTIPAAGAQTFQVGGTLAVAKDQISGVYSGTLPITIAYQ